MLSTTPVPAAVSANVSVHTTAGLALVLGIVPRAPRLPSDIAALVAFAGTRTVRSDSIREMIAATLTAAKRAA